MKKILLATTLLAASTGVAAAEVAVSGSARMGLIYDGNDTMFTSRVRVSFAMSGETDGGLSFGAAVRADQSGQGNTANNDSTVYISGAFGKLTFGDVDTAANALVGHVSGVGLTGLGDTNELRYLGHDKTAALYEGSAGALSYALSSGQIGSANDTISAAVKYSSDAFAVALGVEDNGLTHIALGASATFGAATVKAVISDLEGADTWTALSVDYAAGAATITAFATDKGAVNTYGLGVAYDLGGGAKVLGGIVDNGVDTVADVGISMSF
jgi:outer membrane protein OmpU